VILPLAAQIHFLSNFHKEGYVYVHPSSFGYEADDPVFEGQCDKSGGIRLCKKGDAGRYSLATPRPGATADYWDNAYHFGDRDPPNGGSVSYFPILQPVLILALAASSAVLSALVLFAVFRRPSRPFI
jgi:hypothetical protein